MRVMNLTGQRYGRVVVVGRSGSDRRGTAQWRYRCDCGRDGIALSDNLRFGRTRSCGCLNRDAAAVQHRTHGESVGKGTPEYNAWCTMWKRCTNQTFDHYRHYGGRGITVCDRWVSYEAFLADMGRRPTSGHSLDRVDNDGNYEPSNCRWATRSEQCRNQRPRQRHADGKFL